MCKKGINYRYGDLEISFLATTGPSRVGLSAVVLAGGQSRRMGTDKAFLEYRGKPFITLITSEMLKVSNEVVVMIGSKEVQKFREVLDKRVKVAKDSEYLSNPVGGITSSLPLLSNGFVAFLACDIPLIRAEVISSLNQSAIGHDAAVPTWEDGRIEPLCAVYNVRKAKAAGKKTLAEKKPDCKQFVHNLRDVVFVDVAALRRFDPDLLSFSNVNSREEFGALRERA